VRSNGGGVGNGGFGGNPRPMWAKMGGDLWWGGSKGGGHVSPVEDRQWAQTVQAVPTNSPKFAKTLNATK